MDKSKTTKRAWLTSALSVLACVAMLIGTTFAWFTDTAKTNVNKIQSGTLDVALEMKNSEGKWENAENKTLNFKTADGRTTNILWEPGCTYELPELRVVNNGNLALKYKIQITGINGDAELNKVIDWTMKLDNEDFVVGSEHHLAAKDGDTVDADELTIKGHMQETAGNTYQNKTIDGVAITVVATQDTVEHDSISDQYDTDAEYPVVATGDVKADKDTLLKDKEENPTVTALVPAGSTSAEKLMLTKTQTTTPANISVVTGTQALSANVTLVDQNGDKVSATAGKFFTLTMQLKTELNVIGFYHNDAALTKVASAEAVYAANDTYYYDATTGVLTYSTDDFSPFTVVVSDSEFNGGKGTKDAPYLIATGEQAYGMRDAKGYFKFVNDVVVTKEIYLSGKTYTVDLNGHSVKLEYADDVKPNNGGVFNIAGKKSSLTINDSSEAQTGAVIGSDKTYSNKVTSAVRVGNYGKLTINGGHFYGKSKETSCIFVATSRSSGSKATVTINGGIFETANPLNGTYYVLNHQDSNTTGCTITVNGGQFKNYNPGVTVVDPENPYTGKVDKGTGCKTTERVDGNDTWYIVSK